MQLFLHLLEPSAEYEYFYHNRKFHTPAVGVEIPFARSAWPLFPLLGDFLSCEVDRRLTVRTAVHSQALPRGFFPAAFCEQHSMSATGKRL